MIFRQLKECEYNHFIKLLIQSGRKDGLDASFSITMKVNDGKYIIKIQPAKKCKIYALQALEVCRNKHEIEMFLITDNSLLLSLLNILLYQGFSSSP